MHARVWYTFVYVIFGFWSAAIFPAAPRAAGLFMDTTIGFNGLVQMNRWTPVTVVLENRGRSVKGTLEIRLTSGNEYRGDVFETSYTMDVSLPYGSKKRCAFTVLLRSVTHDVKVRFRSDEKIFVENTVNLKKSVIERDLALVLDSRISPEFLSSLPEQVFAARIDPKHLPNTWYGYDGVRMLILNPAMLKRINPRQYMALEKWLKGGGFLVTSAGINYGSFGEDRMKRLLPVEIKGHARVSEKTALEKFSGQKFNEAEPLLVLDARIKQSETLAAANGVPLMVRKRVKRGIILFIGFDVQSAGFNRWAGRKAFWRKILANRPAPEKSRNLLSEQQIADAMLSNIELKFPHFWSTVLFLVVYVTVWGILMKSAGKQPEIRKQAAIWLVLSTIIFSLIGSWIFFRGNRLNRINFNSFYLLSGNGRDLNGSGKYIFGVYSIKNAPCRIEFKESPYPIRHVLTKKSRVITPNPYSLMDGANGRQIKTHLPKWSHSFFSTDIQKDLPVSARLVIEKKMLYLTVENRSVQTIQNGLIYVKRQFFPIGDIAAKETKKIHFEPDPSRTENQTKEPGFERRFISMGQTEDPSYFQDVKQHLAKDLITRVLSTYNPDNDAALLLGWIRTGIIEPDVNESTVRGEGITLIDWEIPVEGDNEL
jgi:hypothetical protein